MQRAKAASVTLRGVTGEEKNTALREMAASLLEATAEILDENRKDIARAEGRIAPVMIDRLRLTPERIRSMADGILEVAALPDPVGRILAREERPNGLVIEKTSVPMGVIAIIYESRPNVTSDAAALALKAGSACVLRGGKEAYLTSKAIERALKRGVARAHLEGDLISLCDDTTRESARELMAGTGLIDLLIPRGSKGLIDTCRENAKVPVIQTGTGICHIYVDRAADEEKALAILENAKTSRPSVCNAAEVCVLNREIVKSFLPKMKKILVDDRAAAGKTPVELRLSSRVRALLGDTWESFGTAAGDEDFDTEFLDYILAVEVADDVSEAIRHISLHSSGHSESIVTEEGATAERFLTEVDSAAVYHNASTRFTDGGEFGLGCEMGISTQKLHARGPMGLSELTAYKYIIRGDGQIR